MTDNFDMQPDPGPQAPPSRPDATPAGSFDFNRPTIVGLLYVASCLVGVTCILGLVLAYVWKAEDHQPWEATHYVYLIRTFWLGLAGAVIGSLTLIILIGFPILLAVGIWVLVRTVVSLVKAQRREAIPDPRTLLI
jgi:uncharacterized membrane protein